MISKIFNFASIKDKILATGSVVVKDSLNQLDVKNCIKKSAIKYLIEFKCKKMHKRESR